MQKVYNASNETKVRNDMAESYKLVDTAGKKKNTISFRVDDKVLEVLKKLADKQGVTVGQSARRLLFEQLDISALELEAGDTVVTGEGTYVLVIEENTSAPVIRSKILSMSSLGHKK